MISFFKENIAELLRVVISAVILLVAFVIEKTGVLEGYVLLALYIPAFLAVGYAVIFDAAKNIVQKNFFNECLLMLIAAIGAFAIGEYTEGVLVVLLYQIGELFMDAAVFRSKQAIKALGATDGKDKALDEITVEDTNGKGTKVESMLSKFAKWYTPIVVTAAVIVAFLPLAFGQDFKEWVYRALSFLVVACPCAILISVPLAYFLGIGGASSKGIILLDASNVNDLARVKTVADGKDTCREEGEYYLSEVTQVSTADGSTVKTATLENTVGSTVKISYKSDAVQNADDKTAVALAVKRARHTKHVALSNIVFTLAVKIAIMVLGLFGITPLALSVFGDVGVTVLAVLNSFRALR